jgi:hypothetical protein
MPEVSVTMLRNHLQEYLTQVQKGAEIRVTLHGEVIAKILSPVDEKQEAKKKLKILSKNCHLLDVVSPINDRWEVDQ